MIPPTLLFLSCFFLFSFFLVGYFSPFFLETGNVKCQVPAGLGCFSKPLIFFIFCYYSFFFVLCSALATTSPSQTTTCWGSFETSRSGPFWNNALSGRSGPPLARLPGPGGLLFRTGLCWMIGVWRGGMGERERGRGRCSRFLPRWELVVPQWMESILAGDIS